MAGKAPSSGPAAGLNLSRYAPTADVHGKLRGVPNWRPINEAAAWQAVLVAHYVESATPEDINTFLDDTDGTRRHLPRARLVTDFVARTLIVRLEAPSPEAIDSWSSSLRASPSIAVVQSA